MSEQTVKSYRMIRIGSAAALVAIAGLLCLVCSGPLKSGQLVGAEPGEPVNLEFQITQDLDLIRYSLFGELPQFAIWLEDPDTGEYKTVYVTRRSGTGIWVGKVDCPDALPRWFEVFRAETGRQDLPSRDNPAPDGMTGATPEAESFALHTSVPPNSRWICWVEMNLAGDFNDAYKDHDAEKQYVDVHLSGQPPLLYRGEIEAHPGRIFPLELAGQVHLNRDGSVDIEPVGDDITTAKGVFQTIQVRVIEGAR